MSDAETQQSGTEDTTTVDTVSEIVEESVQQVTAEAHVSMNVTGSEEVSEPEVPTVEPTATAIISVAAHKSSESKVALMIEQQLQNYIDAMVVKAPDPVQGGQWQKTLFQLLKQVLSVTDPEKFRIEWNTILNVAEVNKEGVFHENYIFRFPQHWNLSDAEGSSFRRLITLIKMTGDHTTRFQQSNAVHLERATTGLTETQKNNILNFYN